MKKEIDLIQNQLKNLGYVSSSIDKNLNLPDAIQHLKKEKNAVLLAHYYQEPDIQELADYLGDSLYLAQQAAKVEANIIDFAKFKAQHPNAVVVTYINCSAEIKALSDIVCTSSNAVKVIESIPRDQEIIFAPDKNLGRYLIKETGRDMILWDGACIVHEAFSFEKIVALAKQYPKAKFIAHPESESPVLEIAQYVGSTAGLLRYVQEDASSSYIVATEAGILHEMQKRCPQKTFIPAPVEDDTCACSECAFMKLNTLEKLYNCMLYELPEITLDSKLMEQARRPIERMLKLS